MEIKAFREGKVVTKKMETCGCCHMIEVENELLGYLELVMEDGSRRFVYENQEGYALFEENFMSKRFTSFHEFFTTEELAVEERGSLKLKYYVRRPESDYEIGSLEEKRATLEGVDRLPDRYTVFGRYDKKVNYHENEVCC